MNKYKIFREELLAKMENQSWDADLATQEIIKYEEAQVKQALNQYNSSSEDDFWVRIRGICYIGKTECIMNIIKSSFII